MTLPRGRYRTYLADIVNRAHASVANGSTLSVLTERAIGLEAITNGYRVHLSSGQSLSADRVVLALGAPPAEIPKGVDPAAGWISNPLRTDVHARLSTDSPVLLLGTGLTMVDAALLLARHRPDLPLVARSHHGLVPLPQPEQFKIPTSPLAAPTDATALAYLHAGRRVVDEAIRNGQPWQWAVDDLRRSAPAWWANLCPLERQRFVRHMGRRWAVVSHRMARPVHDAITALRDDGRLDVGKGALHSLSLKDGRSHAVLNEGGQERTLEVGAVLDCRGPGGDPALHPLVARALAEGVIRRGEGSPGLFVAPDGTLDVQGRLHSLGWLRKGAEFESAGIPELRRQADALASLVNA